MVCLAKGRGKGKETAIMKHGAWQLKFTGVVQGVGFRPYIYRLAQKHALTGWVINSNAGLTVWVEGEDSKVFDFYQTILIHPPRLSKITHNEISPKLVSQGYTCFSIRSSLDEGEPQVLIAPDVATCSDCLRELFDCQDQRYHYPFINCTNCGPRFTIIRDVPYDRTKTTMDNFPMCSKCHSEYITAQNRRFHAQPNACSVCGPQTVLMDSKGIEYSGLGQDLLCQGKILAVKGIGGFHLVCNAKDKIAIRELRRRKQRIAKPFAVMCRDLEVVQKYCFVSEEEAELLLSPMCPIVILERRQEKLLLDKEISPGVNTLGVMLPYTPLHHLLFIKELEMLVMTSANLSDEPLITDNQEALTKLAGIADYFLFHNRDIFNRCDDSVTRIAAGKRQIYRRARGYVPLPIYLLEDCKQILACGSETKNTFCLVKGRQAFLSQHLGALNHYENYRQYSETIPRLKKIANIEPEIVAFDLHPDYLASRYGRNLNNLVQIGVQHHHAHMASCMAENHLEGQVLGVICDGNGYGMDGAVWGFEFLYGDYGIFERLAHLEYLPLPGGEAAILSPSRMAFTYLYCLLGERGIAAARKYLTDLSVEEQEILRQQIRHKVACSLTSSCGRLFDAVSALLGVCTRVSYEGQAAIELETVSDTSAVQSYPYSIYNDLYPYCISVKPMLEAVLEDLDKRVAGKTIAGKFHITVVNMITEMLLKLHYEKGFNRVVLSGGTFQNRLLFVRLLENLKGKEFEVYYHQEVPTNDGGLSLGQALIANEVVGRVSGNCGKNHIT